MTVTSMQLVRPPVPPRRPLPCAEWTVVEARIAPAAFLAIYRTVGDTVQWDDRARMTPAALAAHLAAPTTRVFLLEGADGPAGLCEFEACDGAGAVLANFGVVPALRGRGVGRYLLHRALEAVLRPGGTIRLDTDTNDDPRAIGVYRDAGFEVVAVGPKDFPD
ncbi:GNAT family N-acetyltransferase [Oharaeibacter diazotrophicus]|uniref:GNAT family N-acetyltransferase n=1 Tax=Oharaeibacter diazotrophicus TaxID=1920512 RepID=UPI0013F6285A|nr:GNAT family N-acetyltransferase [Oharaeibacter diazotrophicus]